MNYITPFDDYPIHQAIEPITIPGPTDRNFYDRYFFKVFSSELSLPYFLLKSSFILNIN